ncbi:hypothetical protein PanWU01x14_056720 [Parasponia andersonii]|uniref:Uncharacterized protein n=1 Tax=Parasponia andersonii TaxID=3476 RepID=A0A2P5DJP3_PARAD|nr:hypothetical protein PanWU01x14_056720 [Parasponia andersonii]
MFPMLETNVIHLVWKGLRLLNQDELRVEVRLIITGNCSPDLLISGRNYCEVFSVTKYERPEE